MTSSTPISNNPLASLLSSNSSEDDSWRWATITSLDPLRIKLDGDSEPLLSTPYAITPVRVGDRVLVHIYHRRATIIGVAGGYQPNPPQPPPDNSIWVSGTWYRASGIQTIPAYSWVNSGNGWYATTIAMPLPYTPPVGYGFTYSMLDGNGFTLATTANPSNTTTNPGVTHIRLLNFNHSAPNLKSVQWHLAKQT